MNSDNVHGYLESFSGSKLRKSSIIIDDLEKYGVLLKKWQKVQNLVSRETFSDLWQRHFLDSLQIIEHLLPEDNCLVDIGSGGGLPAIPIAIALKPKALQYHLIESNKRKVSFLRTVGRELNLDINIHSIRAEQFDRTNLATIDVITSRATAGLPLLLEFAYPLISKTTRCLFHKGVDYREELDESRATWRFNVISNASKTSDVGVILEITNLEKR